MKRTAAFPAMSRIETALSPPAPGLPLRSAGIARATIARSRLSNAPAGAQFQSKATNRWLRRVRHHAGRFPAMDGKQARSEHSSDAIIKRLGISIRFTLRERNLLLTRRGMVGERSHHDRGLPQVGVAHAFVGVHIRMMRADVVVRVFLNGVEAGHAGAGETQVISIADALDDVAPRA